MGVEFVRANETHIAWLAANMRQADRDEVEASGFASAEAALRVSMERSAFAMTAIIDGEPAAMFGAGDLNILARVGAPWLLATPVMEADRRLLLRQSIAWRRQLLERYDILRNAVDDRNKTSIRWLRWMGFSFSEPMPLGANGELFRVFELRR